MVEDEDRILTPEEASDFLRIKLSTLRDYVRKGKIKAVKNMINDSLLGVKESELHKILQGETEGKPKVEEPKSEASVELTKKKSELEALKVDKEIALEKEGIKDAKELRDRTVELERREKEVVERENGIEARMELIIQGEKALAEKQEQDKALYLARINRIDQEEKKHKEAREKDDAERKERSKALLSFTDDLAQKIYNPPPQSISKSLQNQLIASIEPIMESYGLHSQFDGLDRYIPLGDRYLVEPSEVSEARRETRRERIMIHTNGAIPEQVQICYAMCYGIFQWMENKEPIYGLEFCMRISAKTKQLRALVKDKNEDEIVKQQDNILQCFRMWHKYLMWWAEFYENAQGYDFTDIKDWLCDCARVLEEQLGVGVVDDGDYPRKV